MEEKELFLKLRHSFGLSRASKQNLKNILLFSQLMKSKQVREQLLSSSALLL